MKINVSFRSLTESSVNFQKLTELRPALLFLLGWAYKYVYQYNEQRHLEIYHIYVTLIIDPSPSLKYEQLYEIYQKHKILVNGAG